MMSLSLETGSCQSSVLGFELKTENSHKTGLGTAPLAEYNCSMSCMHSLSTDARVLRRLAASMVCGLALVNLAATAMAQQRLSTPILTQAVRNGWLRFDLASGRIGLSGGAAGNISTSSSSNGQTESFSLSGNNGEPVLRYSRSNSGEAFSVLADGGKLLKIKRAMQGQPEVEFTQTHGEPLSFVVKSADNRQEYRGATLWHVFLAYPEVTSASLIPAIEPVSPEWNLTRLFASVEKCLLRRAFDGEDVRRNQWAENVRQLGSEEFARREAADRRLRASGAAGLAYLEQLDPKDLDAEQQFRVRRIVGYLAVKLGDSSAEQIAARLAGDTTIWLAFLDRPEVAVREAAAKQLGLITKSAIEFEANAPQEVRARQIEKLRLSLASPAARGKMDDAAPRRVGAP